MDRYSWWLAQAFPSRRDRQQHLKRLITNRPLTQANLLLAHLLIDRRISNLVVTTNFDDLLSRALSVFYTPHITCDHPATIQRIEPELDEIQIVHVHGTYWFYDACNVTNEIDDRATPSQDSTFSMRQFLEQLLNQRSPLVIGYSGWERDVFMTALRRRLLTPLKYRIYWFCYDRTQLALLPAELLNHPDVCFVAGERASQATAAGTPASAAHMSSA